MLQKAIIYGREVEYDDSQFEVVKNTIGGEEYSDISEYLHYIGDGKKVSNPKGNILGFGMFMGFKGTSLDLSNFNTSDIVKMDYMFANTGLKRFDYSLDMSKVKTAQGMFEGSENLVCVDLSASNSCNLYFFPNMFADCTALKVVKLGCNNALAHSQEIDADDMFICCPSICYIAFNGLVGTVSPDFLEVILPDKFDKVCTAEKQAVLSDVMIIQRGEENIIVAL